jgi:hypothetical protein
MESRISVPARANSNLLDLKPVNRRSVRGQSWQLGVLSCNASSRYLATTSEQTEDFMHAVLVVI